MKLQKIWGTEAKADPVDRHTVTWDANLVINPGHHLGVSKRDEQSILSQAPSLQPERTGRRGQFTLDSSVTIPRIRPPNETLRTPWRSLELSRPGRDDSLASQRCSCFPARWTPARNAWTPARVVGQ